MEHDTVQIQNPKTKLWVKVNRETGVILDYGRTEKQFENVKVASKTNLRDISSSRKLRKIGLI